MSQKKDSLVEIEQLEDERSSGCLHGMRHEGFPKIARLLVSPSPRPLGEVECATGRTDTR